MSERLAQKGALYCAPTMHTAAQWLSYAGTAPIGAGNITGAIAGRSRKAAAALEDDGGWDWQHSRERVLLAARELMLVDLKALFKGLAATERLINLCMELVRPYLGMPTAVAPCWCLQAACVPS